MGRAEDEGSGSDDEWEDEPEVDLKDLGPCGAAGCVEPCTKKLLVVVMADVSKSK